MKELEQAVQVALENMASSGRLTEIIDAKVQKAVEGVIDDCFSYHSSFRRQLGEEINKTLRVDFSGLGLAGYNETLMQIIKAKLDAAVDKFAAKQIAAGLEELLATPPDQIKLSELVNLLRKDVEEDVHYSRRTRSKRISWHVIHPEAESHLTSLTVKLDREPDKPARDCGYDIGVNKSGEVWRIGIPYSGDISKKVFAGPFYGFDRALFQMYAAKTRLILDEDEVANYD